MTHGSDRIDPRGTITVLLEDWQRGEAAALERLAALDARLVQVVEMRFYGGMNVHETAAALDVSPATVKRDWRSARAWLHRELTAGGGADGGP